MPSVENPLVMIQPATVLASESTSGWRDWIGIAASFGCAIHCAAMPFVIAYLPMLGLSFLADEAFHRWMAIACFVIAIAAFVPGFRQHRRFMPGMIAVAGLSLITFAAFGLAGDCCAACELPTTSDASAVTCADACCEHCSADAATESKMLAESNVNTVNASIAPLAFIANFAPWLTPLGGVLLVSAHLLNRRFGCLCGCCETPAMKEMA